MNWLQIITHLIYPKNKRRAELEFWQAELDRYIKWYSGETPLYGFPFPSSSEKVRGHGLKIDAAITWLKLFQIKKYRADLHLDSNALRGLKVLDVGCGPFPNLMAFSNCEKHGLDPLIDLYRNAGYPIDLWRREGLIYHCSPAENIPLPNEYFDAVVSVNAIDHVDDFKRTAQEIKRVLKKNGLIRMHVHYHRKTQTEPIEINDKYFFDHYNWASGLKKISESNKKDMGLYAAPPDELFVVWGNS